MGLFVIKKETLVLEKYLVLTKNVIFFFFKIFKHCLLTYKRGKSFFLTQNLIGKKKQKKKTRNLAVFHHCYRDNRSRRHPSDPEKKISKNDAREKIETDLTSSRFAFEEAINIETLENTRTCS